MNACAADFASDNRVPAMLKLRSTARAIESGNSPAAKFVTVCGSPFSRSSKSDALRPVTGFPCASVTLAYTSTRFTPDVNCACATGIPSTATARRMVIQSSDPAHFQGAPPMGLGVPELIVILFIIIMIFGANRLPEIGRGIGKGIRNFKESTREGLADKRDD
jgi:sec-independent protein translocase protein TatA